MVANSAKDKHPTGRVANVKTSETRKTMKHPRHTAPHRRPGGPCELLAPVGLTPTAVAEVLCYNEMTPPHEGRAGEEKWLVPQCFYARGASVEYISFEGGARNRVAMFRKAGLFRAVGRESYRSDFTVYTIRRTGEDPKVWVEQALQAYEVLQRSSDLTNPLDLCQLQASVFLHTHDLIYEVLRCHKGHIVHIEDKTFPSMVNRVHRLYGVTLDYEAVRTPCTGFKPCLLVTCPRCKIEEQALDARRRLYASQAFLEPAHVAPSVPEWLREIWSRSVATRSTLSR
jgi:hypothetical protein